MGTGTREELTPTMPLIVVRVTAVAATVEEFVGRYARYFRDGEVVFVPTEGVQPSGRRIKFIFALVDGTEVVSGEGVVLRMRRDSGDPRRPPGMELRYQIEDPASVAMVARLLAARKTPPPYVSLRIDGVADSQELTLPIERHDPTPPPSLVPPPARLAPPPPKTPVPLSRAARPLPPIVVPPRPVARPPIDPRPPSPPFAVPHSSRVVRLAGTAVATAAAILAVTLAAALMRRAPSPPPSLPPSSPPPAAAPAVGGNGVVLAAPASPSPAAAVAPPVVTGPRPESTGGARPPPDPRPRLRVTTSPPGALVFVDGAERGSSPLAVSVGAGAHEIVAERPRWLSAHAHVDGPGHIQLVLTRPQARLRIVSTPPGASVRLDGRDVGLTPLELDADAYELHFLRIERDGRVWRRKLYLRPPGGNVRVGARLLINEPGAVRVAHDLGEGVRP